MNQPSVASRGIDSIRAHTESYADDPTFNERWRGLGIESSDYNAQQLRAFAQLLTKVAGTLDGWKVLDVGCGDGKWLRSFVEFGASPADVVGVDVSGVRFGQGRKKNPLITMIETDGATIPFDNDSFDLVTQFVCFSNMPSVTLRKQVADEITRVLRPEGFVFWWDLPFVTAPGDQGADLFPSDYFPRPMEQLRVGRLPKPAECLLPRRGVGRLLGSLLKPFGHPSTHVAALIGGKNAS